MSFLPRWWCVALDAGGVWEGKFWEKFNFFNLKTKYYRLF